MEWERTPFKANHCILSPGLNTQLVVLTFQVQADPPPIAAQWYFNGSLIQNNNVYQISNITAADNSTGSILYNTSLVIGSVDPTTQGYYFVSFFSTKAGVTNTTFIYVTPPSTSGPPSSSIAAAVGAAVGASVSVTFVVSFSLGVLVASVLCYISRRSKESYKPSLHADPATVYEVMGTNKEMKGDGLEINTNTAYGLVSTTSL